MTTSEDAAFLARNVLAGDQIPSDDTAGRARRRPAAVPRRPVRLASGRTPTREPAGNAAVDLDGPHVRLGVAWALVTLVALMGGPIWVAVWMAPAAAMAAGSSLRSWQDRPNRPDHPNRPDQISRSDRPNPSVEPNPPDRVPRQSSPGPPVAHPGQLDRPVTATPGAEHDVASQARARRPVPVQPPVPLAAGAAGLITLVSAAGLIPTVTFSALVAVAILAGATFGPRGVPDAARRVLIVLLPAAGASGLVLSRAQGMPAGVVLAGMVCVYDSAAYLIGTDAKSRWEGPVAGLASVAALTVLVAAVLAPPFRGSSPWILGGLAAVLAPLGPMVARMLIREPSARVPALRRLDSLLLLGPAWAVGAALLARP